VALAGIGKGHTPSVQRPGTLGVYILARREAEKHNPGGTMNGREMRKASSARCGGRRLWFGIGSTWIVSVLVLAFSGCAGLSCQPVSITVAKKEERARLETVPHGYTTETGRLEELRRPEIVRDYWVQDADGTWHRVSLEHYRATEVGQVLDICR